MPSRPAVRPALSNEYRAGAIDHQAFGRTVRAHGAAVKAGQATGKGADPQVAAGVLGEGTDAPVTKPGFPGQHLQRA